MSGLIISTAGLGLLWAVMALGVFISYRILDIADLSVEGTFPLGGAVSAVLITKGASPFLSLAAAAAAGMVAGAVTGLLHTKLKIPALLSGILTMIAMYSINLRVMGKANLSLIGEDTVFSLTKRLTGNMSTAAVLVGGISVIVITLVMYWYFGTEIGMAIRATGFNKDMISAQGVDPDNAILMGLILSNGLVAFAGALISQNNGFADVGMGIGTIVIGLASVIIGEVIFGARSFKNNLISIVLGSVVYRAVIAIVLNLGMHPNDLKLFTAVIVAIALALPAIKAGVGTKKGVV
ncbi:MAG: ABC transporter permease [Clostridiaceae bacterium]